MFQQFQNDAYLETILQRVKTHHLTWCAQFVDLIAEQKPQHGWSINDLGCQVGQFYKTLHQSNLGLQYAGYDIEEQYLTHARRLFPEAAFHRLDLAEAPPPTAHITVISATLEHLPQLSPGLDHILLSTKRFALIRTFLGEAARMDWYQKKGADQPYRIHQFSRIDFDQICAQHGFRVRYIKDDYTGSQPKDLGQGVVRSQHIALVTRIDPLSD